MREYRYGAGVSSEIKSVDDVDRGRAQPDPGKFSFRKTELGEPRRNWTSRAILEPKRIGKKSFLGDDDEVESGNCRRVVSQVEAYVEHRPSTLSKSRRAWRNSSTCTASRSKSPAYMNDSTSSRPTVKNLQTVTVRRCSCAQRWRNLKLRESDGSGSQRSRQVNLIVQNPNTLYRLSSRSLSSMSASPRARKWGSDLACTEPKSATARGLGKSGQSGAAVITSQLGASWKVSWSVSSRELTSEVYFSRVVFVFY